MEIALSQLCDADDVITPIVNEDEAIRREFGFRGPQNYHLPLRSNQSGDPNRRENGQFFNHASAAFIREHVGKEVWRKYFKFCFERDPFDKAISRYYWSAPEPRPEISTYLDSAPSELLSNWDLYTIDDQVAVDFIGRYENLDEDLKRIAGKLGFSKELKLPRAKGGYRKNREHYSVILNAQARARIESVCAKEIKAFLTHWREADKTPNP